MPLTRSLPILARERRRVAAVPPREASSFVPPDRAVDAHLLRQRLDELIDEYRSALHASVDGLTEVEARAQLVPSATTLLGLLKHVTFVEGVWFDQAVTGRSYAEIGIPHTVDASFALSDTDTIASVQETHQRRCEASRRRMAELELDATVTGRGERTVWALYLQVLRELAHHTGHADILREQVVAARVG